MSEENRAQELALLNHLRRVELNRAEEDLALKQLFQVPVRQRPSQGNSQKTCDPADIEIQVEMKNSANKTLEDKKEESKDARYVSYLFSREQPRPKVFDGDFLFDIKPFMLPILVDWLFAVCLRFKLPLKILDRATDYVIRFLADRPQLTRNKLQCCGIACLHVAKMINEENENYSLDASDCRQISAYSFTIETFTDMLMKVLETLDFDFHRPGVIDFLQWFENPFIENAKVEGFGMSEERFRSTREKIHCIYLVSPCAQTWFKPSEGACAILCSTMQTLCFTANISRFWTTKIESMTRITRERALEITKQFRILMQNVLVEFLVKEGEKTDITEVYSKSVEFECIKHYASGKRQIG